MNSTAIITVFIVLFVITIGLFLLFRSIVLWYFKIDVRVRQNDQIISFLKRIPLTSKEEESFERFLNETSKKEKEKEVTNYFIYNQKRVDLKKGFRYLVSTNNGKGLHDLILTNTDQIEFDNESKQFNDYQQEVSFILFHFESTSDKIVHDGIYIIDKNNISAEITINQIFNSDKTDSIKLSSGEIKLKEWNEIYEISFEGILETDERIEGKYVGKIKRLPNLENW
jgi:uncharacterized protein (UPF0333 family)